MKWKIDQYKYTCETIKDKVFLTIRGYHVGYYPLTYTPQGYTNMIGIEIGVRVFQRPGD